MPILDTDALQQTALATNAYGYSATRIDALGATEYTLVSLVCDISGSVAAFRGDLESALQSIVRACRMSPRADNLLLRLLAFNGRLQELHGFKLLDRCRPEDYAGLLKTDGPTALYDATENAVRAVTDYAGRLGAGGFAANAIVFVLTDGQDNASTLPARAVKAAFDAAGAEERLESLASILVGVNVGDPSVGGSLLDFKTDAGFTQYIEIERANAGTLAALANFVTRSGSAQSQALGLGVPSRPLTF